LKNVLNILLITFTLVLFGCQDVLGPQLQDTSTIKTETKWKVSPVNNSKIVKIAFREFNRNGDIVEEMNYDKNGKLKAISEFTFTNGSEN
jgi:hypothetical protein